MFQKKSLIMRVLVFTASITVLCPTMVVAQSANDKVKAQDIATRAKEDFAAGRFEAAAEKYLEAYTLSRKPATLFNAARAKQEAKKFAEARELFRIYKTLPKVGLDGYQEAEKRIAQCEAELEKIEAAKLGPPPIIVEIPKDPTPVDVAVEVTKVVVDDGPQSVVFEPRKLISWQSGASIALLGTGIGLMASGASATSDANKLPFSTAAEEVAYHEAFSSARTRWGIGLGLTAVGAGVAVWSVVRAIDFDPKRSTLLLPTTNGAVLIVKF
jgi:tetratricopeptide (TPR) repeat protein